MTSLIKPTKERVTRYLYTSASALKVVKHSLYVHRVRTWDNPQFSFVQKLMREYPRKDVQYNTKTNKLYLHENVRIISVTREKETGKFIRSKVENSPCHIEIQKDSDGLFEVVRSPTPAGLLQLG